MSRDFHEENFMGLKQTGKFSFLENPVMNNTPSRIINQSALIVNSK